MCRLVAFILFQFEACSPTGKSHMCSLEHMILVQKSHSLAQSLNVER